MKEFNLLPGGLQDHFLNSRSKIQIFGGGYGNGKTTASIAKLLLQVAFAYPGANCLVARATYPKLNDTVRKEFINWCPSDQIASFPMSTNSSNTCTLKNGTTINFRYIAQQGKSGEIGTSNLLSATYDFILVDQIEDPEITHKDFLDLLGRLRGNTVYRGDDETMPRTGPRWLIITANPTRNWFYKEIIKPYHDYQRTGVVGDKLLCYRDNDGSPTRNSAGQPILMMSLVEGGTEENAHNLDRDFIESLRSTYTGQMRARFFEGKWAAYEGLVYPQFDPELHCVPAASIRSLLLSKKGKVKLEWLEGYDYGLASPSCYLLAFIDEFSNIYVVDGYYRTEYKLGEQYAHIKKIRKDWATAGATFVNADPAIFRRTPGSHSFRISDDFWMNGRIMCKRGDNDVMSGIAKVSGYLQARYLHRNPFTMEVPAPTIYFNEELEFLTAEMVAYYWRRSKHDEKYVDTPVDNDDHAMDALKYLLTDRLPVSNLIENVHEKVPKWMKWQERDSEDAL